MASESKRKIIFTYQQIGPNPLHMGKPFEKRTLRELLETRRRCETDRVVNRYLLKYLNEAIEGKASEENMELISKMTRKSFHGMPYPMFKDWAEETHGTALDMAKKAFKKPCLLASGELVIVSHEILGGYWYSLENPKKFAYNWTNWASFSGDVCDICGTGTCFDGCNEVNIPDNITPCKHYATLLSDYMCPCLEIK